MFPSHDPGLGWYALPKFVPFLRKRGMFPQGALTMEQLWILEQDGFEIKPWNGVYIQGGEYFKFDKPMMTKLAKLMLPDIEAYLDARTSIFIPKAFKARINRLADHSYNDAMMFITGEEYVQISQKAQKKKRKSKKDTI